MPNPYPPPWRTWSVWSNFAEAAAGAQTICTQAAAGSNQCNFLEHVCVIANGLALANTTIVVRDGASGTGTIKQQFTLRLTNGGSSPQYCFVAFECGILGSVNTAMTIEATAAVAAVQVSINVSGSAIQIL